MLDILLLFGAIALLIALQLYRNMLAFVFPTARVDAVDIARPPEATADLHAAAEAELQALGFAGPCWYLLRPGNDATDAGLVVAAYVRDEGDVCWLYPMSAADKPNRLNAVFATRLADGRTAISQAFDPYFEMTATPQRPSRTIGGETLAAQWQSHRDWTATLGSAPDPAGATPEGLAAFQRDVFDGARQRLLDDGRAWLDSRGWARPTLRYAWRMMRAVLRRPKSAPNTAPVPPARLAALALFAQRIVERPAPARMQAGLFVLSTALFLALGAVFWSVEFAVILFVVVAIHELGHYLAMRAFGYRNVQMLALPLVGGVTIGHEAKPDAARRAWMSLMGPLPGVVIGWGMLLATLWIDAPPSWWTTVAIVFLGVNYLNVLPVPPLDGGHVVQALLPVRAARLQAVFIVVACVAGAVLAYNVGFMLLVVLALMQLSLAASHWQLARVIGRAYGDAGLDPQRPRALRLRRVFEIADELFGTTPKAAPRIAQATQALHSLDVKPMHWLQRSVIGVVYVALLAGPLAGAGWWWTLSRPQPLDARQQAKIAEIRQEGAEFEARVTALDLATLVREAASGAGATEALPPPATDEAIAAAQARLRVALPDDLAAFYRIADGAPSLGLLPLASVARVGDTSQVALDAMAPDGTLDVYAYTFDEKAPRAPAEPHKVDAATAREWLVVSSPEFDYPLTYDVGDVPRVPGHRLIDFDGDGVCYATSGLRRWLERRWIEQQSTRLYARRLEDAVATAKQELSGLSMPALLDRLPRPDLLERLVARTAGLPGTVGAGDAADAAAIAAAEQRVGATLPDDLRVLLDRHDGIPQLRILPVENVRRLDLADAATRRKLDEVVDPVPHGIAGDRPPNWPTSVDELAGCNVIGGFLRQNDVAPGILWCPHFAEGRRLLDLRRQRSFATLTDYVREHLAQAEALKRAL